MKLFELVVTVMLKRSVDFRDTFELLGNNINWSMLNDPVLKEKHEQTGIKHYVFNSFYPLEKDKIYKSGKVYYFCIRSIDKDFAIRLKKCLSGLKTQDLQVIAVELKTKEQKFISELYTVTPAIMVIESNHHWLKEDGLDILKTRIHDNLVKKYETYFGEKLENSHNLVKGLEVRNTTPFLIHYKKGTLFCNKFNVFIHEDEISQKLAFMALACGLLEKGSAAGTGYCFAN